MIPETVNILLVEDDDVDAEAVRRGFSKARVTNRVFRATNGAEALETLRNDDSPMRDAPYLILLDLRMPRMNGLEFLDEIRHDEDLQNSSVFVLTTSTAALARSAAYARFIAGYITKSKAGVDFMDLIRMLECYGKIVEFPRVANK